MGLIIPLVFLGLMASLSPATIVVFVLVLGTARARVNAVGFLFGWGLSLTFVFLGSYALAASGATQSDDGRTSVAVLQVLLGSAMLVVGRPGVATRGARHQPDGAVALGSGPAPRPHARPDARRCRGRRRAQATLGDHHRGGPGRGAPPHDRSAAAIAFVLFTVASTATVGLMFLYYARYPGEAQTQLAILRDRVVAAGPAVAALAGMLVGAFLVVDGLLGLT